MTTGGEFAPGSFNREWCGYQRREVDAAIKQLTERLEQLTTDRDAALATADDVTRELEAARAELAEYRMLHAGYSKENTVSGTIRYLMHVARQKAEKEEQAAHERSEELLRQAREIAHRQAVLLDETEQETQRRLAEADRRAREIVADATAQARAIAADLVERRKVLDRWCAQLGIPVPREDDTDEPPTLAAPATAPPPPTTAPPAPSPPADAPPQPAPTAPPPGGPAQAAPAAPAASAADGS
ncbi:hypothetical protein [Saccharothrix variisporea]|uniref:DivIVA protein n=1 Tax=Saccharothrix variisporea TaxID=543527 RepID=A0A495XA65_9PSEU|nr:hypothetical protein [Saccharothrix variisporea]RKT70266.1 hypothetical protein DFJ66_3522 [Saccharothrix variisporea]